MADNETNFIKSKWDLKKYFYVDYDENFKRDINKISSEVQKFKTKYEGKIGSLTPEDLLLFFQEEEKLDLLVNKPTFYVFYRKSLNQFDEDTVIWDEKLNNIFVEISNELLFVSQEFKDLGENKLLELSSKEELKDYKKVLVDKAKSIKYQLSEKEEFILNVKESTSSSSFVKLYDEFTTAFQFEIDIDNESKQLTREEVSHYLQNPNRDLRKKAQESLYNIYSNQKTQIVLSNLYLLVVKDWISEKKLRHYKTSISIRNFVENLDDETVEMLLGEVEKNYNLYHQYLNLKKKILDLNELWSYDLYAPFNNEVIEMSFEDSVNEYLRIIKNFDMEFYEYSKDMLTNGRVDVYPDKNKVNGAFANYAKGFESFVLLNHTKSRRSFFTLAHELGHAIHGHLSQKQNSHNFESPLNLAETASIFNETLVFDALLNQANSKEEKIEMITSKLEDLFATIFRQVQYILFEKKIHNIINDGEYLTIKQLNLYWREEQVKFTSDIVKYLKKPEEESYWSAIPHIFHTPFYCYTYAFGNILSLNLYENYKKKGKDFVPSYKDILSSGGSKKTYDLLMEYGIDINSKKFYDTAFSYVKDLLCQLEQLVK